MASLAEPGQSRAVLVGVSSYQHLEVLNAVANNLTDLAGELTAENVWRLPADNCVVAPDPKTASEMLDPLEFAAQAATDTLLFYFAAMGWRRWPVRTCISRCLDRSRSECIPPSPMTTCARLC